ncbi:MAG: sigma-54 factor interaction domain-containing protein [Proteobacteria bacterium]|nr:sigma-54 factor interaction domain-containing protein [Pseudomonadota bacterium]MBU4296767.1 sigma-54 factor interaction domain-containing protein [Pseudomonadota bacterium]MCG2747184.1 sigma-54 factor interaction domain-containing protein [Desulfobulbaceae bacterium]
MERIISGTIFWPLFPFGLVKSELGHQHRRWSEEEVIVCPNKSENLNCLIQNKICFYERRKDGAASCPYKDYHSYFLLERQAKIKNTIPVEADSSLKGIRDINDNLLLRNAIGKSREVVSEAMNHFPQYKDCGNKLLAGNLCGKWPSDKTKPDGYKLDALQIWKDVGSDKPVFPLRELTIREKFYVGCEFLGGRERDGMPAEIAFHHLIDISQIKCFLPTAKTKPAKNYIIPVQLSFFGDGKLDALLSLQYTCKDEEKIAVKKFISQALGSVAWIVKRQRSEFLHQWCRDLRSMVGKRFDAAKSEAQSEDDKIAKKTAIDESVEAMKSMALVLWADNEIKLQDNNQSALKSQNFQFDYDLNKFCDCVSKKCWGNNAKKHADRCDFICDFCKQAKTSIEESFSTGKLKGALSRNTSDELITIATEDSIRARVLLQGGAGGGKGVAAKDFHAHCIKRIAKTLSKLEIGSNKKGLLETDFVLDTTKSMSFLMDWWKAIIKGEIDYLIQIENVLRSLRDLPSNVEKTDSKDVYDYFRVQVIGTGWWRWGNGKGDSKPHYDKLNTLINHFKVKYGYPTDQGEDSKWDWCIQTFLLLLGMKLVVELQQEAKADWDFNLFQVNCGIMGGENSELAESILRLFGRSEKDKEAPGIFQTCSYVGGTLFLDEIADAPVRIQDNLLRPLEEGKVSRPGWETIDEKVKNIRIVGATFKNLFELSAQYQETLPTGKPRGFRPDLLTRLTRNPPVNVVPIWQHFVPDGKYSEKALRNQFCYVMSEATAKEELNNKFWDDVYQLVKKKLDDHCKIAAKHLPDERDRRRHFASKITMRLFMAFKDRKFKDREKENLKGGHKEYLDHMLDYLLCDS